MLARVRNPILRRIASCFVLASVALTLGACATKREPVLISDGTSQGESSLPWNQQQKWENTGQFGQLADHMQNRR